MEVWGSFFGGLGTILEGLGDMFWEGLETCLRGFWDVFERLWEPFGKVFLEVVNYFLERFGRFVLLDVLDRSFYFLFHLCSFLLVISCVVLFLLVLSPSLSHFLVCSRLPPLPFIFFSFRLVLSCNFFLPFPFFAWRVRVHGAAPWGPWNPQ